MFESAFEESWKNIFKIFIPCLGGGCAELQGRSLSAGSCLLRSKIETTQDGGVEFAVPFYGRYKLRRDAADEISGNTFFCLKSSIYEVHAVVAGINSDITFRARLGAQFAENETNVTEDSAPPSIVTTHDMETFKEGFASVCGGDTFLEI